MGADETAYRRYLTGDEQAAAELVEKYADALVRYLNSCLHDPEEAEDLMIEAFARLFAKERPLGDEGSFKAYLFRTGRNLALRHIGRLRLPLISWSAVPFELPDELLTEAAFCRGERHGQLRAALDGLKAEYREALYLVYFEGESYRDAARIMGKTEAQITNLIYRGKQRLRAVLEEGGFEYAEQ